MSDELALRVLDDDHDGSRSVSDQDFRRRRPRTTRVTMLCGRGGYSDRAGPPITWSDASGYAREIVSLGSRGKSRRIPPHQHHALAMQEVTVLPFPPPPSSPARPPKPDLSSHAAPREPLPPRPAANGAASCPPILLSPPCRAPWRLCRRMAAVAVWGWWRPPGAWRRAGPPCWAARCSADAAPSPFTPLAAALCAALAGFTAPAAPRPSRWPCRPRRRTRLHGWRRP